MIKYARRDAGGHWIDVYVVPSQFYFSLADLERKTGVTGFVQVDMGVENGALDLGNGTYANPDAIPLKLYKTLSQGAVLGVFDDVFSAARTNALDAALDATTDDNLTLKRKRFRTPSLVFTRAQVLAFLMDMRQGDIPTANTKITLAEINAVAAHSAWG